MQYVLCCMLALSVNLPLWARAAAAPVPQPMDNSRADARFRSMDTDNKGFVSFEDFQRRHPGMQASAFDAIDADKDGRISLEEWRTFFQHHGAMGAMPPSGQSMGGQGGGSLIRPPAKAGSGAN